MRQETPLDRTFVLRVDAPEGVFDFQPGQFVIVTDPNAEKPLRRAYSLSSAPEEGPTLSMTVRDMGDFGAQFYRFPAGKQLKAEAPMGRFTLPDAEGVELVMVAGGSGVTPFRSFLVHLAARAHDWRVWLLQSAQQANELVFHDTFAGMADEHDWLTYTPTVTRAPDDDPWQGLRGRFDRERLLATGATLGDAWYYACGPGAFVKAMLALGLDLGVDKKRQKKEQWG